MKTCPDLLSLSCIFAVPQVMTSNQLAVIREEFLQNYENNPRQFPQITEVPEHPKLQAPHRTAHGSTDMGDFFG